MDCSIYCVVVLTIVPSLARVSTGGGREWMGGSLIRSLTVDHAAAWWEEQMVRCCLLLLFDQVGCGARCMYVRCGIRAGECIWKCSFSIQRGHSPL